MRLNIKHYKNVITQQNNRLTQLPTDKADCNTKQKFHLRKNTNVTRDKNEEPRHPFRH